MFHISVHTKKKKNREEIRFLTQGTVVEDRVYGAPVSVGEEGLEAVR
jgi:GMP synthase PP-ATPase subunit